MPDEPLRVYVGSQGRRRRFLSMYYIDPETGKAVRRSTETDDRKAAEKKAAVWEDELNSGRYNPVSRITWEEFRSRYEREKLAGLAEGTRDQAATALNHFERIIRPARVGVITSSTMSRFQAALREGTRQIQRGEETITRGTQEATIVGILRYVHVALKWAVGMGMLAKMPKIHWPKRAKGKTLMKGRPITAEEFERMADKVEPALTLRATKRRPNPPPPLPEAVEGWRHLLKGLWLSGLRLGEALVLSWDADAAFAVDLNSRYPMFRISAEAQKSHRDQVLPITADFAQFLMETPKGQRHGPVFKALDPTTGRSLSEKRVSRRISSFGRAANIVVHKQEVTVTKGGRSERRPEPKYASAHDLRRAFGTRWAKRVMPAVLQKLMRHANIETTLKYYVDLDADALAEELWKSFPPTEANDPQKAKSEIVLLTFLLTEQNRPQNEARGPTADATEPPDSERS